MLNKNELILPSAYALEGRGINPGTQQTTILKASSEAFFYLKLINSNNNWNFMALNGISILETKELRQIAKLDLAQSKRQTVDTPGYRVLNVYDILLLPTRYSGNDIVDNPNVDGLVPGRPWTP